MPNFLFEFFEKYIANVNRIHNQEIKDIKTALSEARAGEESLRKALDENFEYNTLENISLFNSLVIELQKERDDIKLQLEKKIRDQNLLNVIQHQEQLSLQERVKELELKLLKKKEKSKELKKVQSEYIN
jgi:hypothetical protein